MDRKKFIEQVRNGAATFRVDDVRVLFPGSELSGSGQIDLSADGFGLDLRLPEGAEAPRMRGGVLTKKDFGTLEGVIDHDLRFEVKNLPRFHEYSSHNGRLTLRYDLDSIELSPTGSDIQTYDQIRRRLELLESVEALPDNGPHEIASSKGKEASNVTFSGLLLGFKLIARNAATHFEERNDFLGTRTSTQSDTQCGRLSDDWDYGLIQRGEHVEFHLCLRDGRKSTDADQDLVTLDAFLKAIAFIHGQHAWPFTLEFRRDHRLHTDRVRPPRIAKRSPHQPFNERIWFNSVVGNLKWDFGTALQKAYAFFRKKNAVSDEVSNLLFLCREAAGRDANMTITNIALCSFLDSALNLVLKEHVEIGGAERAAKFNDARSALLDFVSLKITPTTSEDDPWMRFGSIISNSEFAAAREKFRAVGECLGLQWDGGWGEIYKFWAKWRPRIVHRGTVGSDSEEEIAAEFNIGSRVVGAIHMLVLKLMRYEGIMVSSTFEDQFRRI
jgi:hypothetical protein